METELWFSYEKLSKYLTEHFNNEYPDCNAVFICFSKEHTYRDWGGDDTYPVIAGRLYLSKKKKILGNVMEVKEHKEYSDKDVNNLLEELLDAEMAAEGEGMEVSYIEAGEKGANIHICEKGKSLWKKYRSTKNKKKNKYDKIDN